MSQTKPAKDLQANSPGISRRKMLRQTITLSVAPDPNRPENVLEVDANEKSVGSDDAADALRYLVATKSRAVTQRKLGGL